MIASERASTYFLCLAVRTTKAAACSALRAVPSAINLSNSAMLSMVSTSSYSALARRTSVSATVYLAVAAAAVWESTLA